jgi:hypothetical protein
MSRGERTYDNSARLEAAQDTRAAIVEAARSELVTGGYRQLTIAAVAAAAGVSPQTIYNSVGNKAALVKAVYDVTIAGDDDPVPMSDRPGFRAIREAPTAAAYALAYAAWCRVLNGRTAPLLAALTGGGAGSDPEIAAFLATIEEERRTGSTHAVAGFAKAHRLPPGLSRQRAADILWTLNDPMVHDRLVRRCGWSPAAYERWLVGQLLATLTGGKG